MLDEIEMKLSIYLDDGRIFSYEVSGEDKAREHSHAIAQTGYRHNNGLVFEHYPPHRILKITTDGPVKTKYKDTSRGT